MGRERKEEEWWEERGKKKRNREKREGEEGVAALTTVLSFLWLVMHCKEGRCRFPLTFRERERYQDIRAEEMTSKIERGGLEILLHCIYFTLPYTIPHGW